MSSLLAIGIGLADIVNGNTGEPTHYFNFMELPLAKYIESIFNLPVLIDSVIRVIGIAELVLGEAVNCYSFFHKSLQSNPIPINAC
jgi:predicted NBD/HSP70 family sugar kinase